MFFISALMALLNVLKVSCKKYVGEIFFIKKKCIKF